MKTLLLLFSLFFSSLTFGEYLESKDMNLGFKWNMYDCITGDICYTKDDGDTFNIDGNYVGNGDVSTFMVYKGKIYFTEFELPLEWQQYRNDIKINMFFRWRELIDAVADLE